MKPQDNSTARLLTLVDWENRACADAPNPDIFTSDDLSDMRAAKRYCVPCPVRERCLQYALDNAEEGVWGGTTIQERDQIRRGADPREIWEKQRPKPISRLVKKQTGRHSVYRLHMTYPIVDDTVGTNEIMRRAVEELPRQAEDRKLGLTGYVEAWIADDMVHVESDVDFTGRRMRLSDTIGNQVARLRAEGKNDRQIGQALGYHTEAIRLVRKSLGLEAVTAAPKRLRKAAKATAAAEWLKAYLTERGGAAPAREALKAAAEAGYNKYQLANAQPWSGVKAYRVAGGRDTNNLPVWMWRLGEAGDAVPAGGTQ